MLLQNPTPPEPRCPRRWSFLAAAGLLALAAVLAGLGAQAAPAPRGGDDSAPQKSKKVEPNKDGVHAQDLRDLLKMLPQGLDAEQMEAIRKQVEEALKQGQGGLDPKQMDDLLKSLQVQQDQIARALQRLHGLHGKFPPEMGAGNFAFGKHAPTGRLGVQIAAPSATLADQVDLPKGQGIVIEEVVPDSPAAKAGIKAHDVLLEVDGKVVPSDPVAAARMVSGLKAGRAVEAVVLRHGRRETLKGLKLLAPKKTDPAAGEFGNFSADKPKALPGMSGMKALQFGAMKGGQAGALALSGMGGGTGVMTTTFRNDDRFTTRHQEGSLVITLTGKVADGKTRVTEIRVQDGGESHDYDDVDSVPERYRDKVKNLLEMTAKGNVRIEIKEP
jgi:hypothetical protein